MLSSFFFFNDTATTEIYTLSLHDALPIWNVYNALCLVVRLADGAPPGGLALEVGLDLGEGVVGEAEEDQPQDGRGVDRKSTRLNSSHLVISYAVFCLKKKKMRVCSWRTRT